MRFITVIALFFMFFTSLSFSQKTIKHTVVEGESFYSIAKKYKVSEADIYELNPKLKGTLLQLKTVLLIPNSNKNHESKQKKITSKDNVPTDTHIVEAGESLYKIALRYKISLEKLKELNPNVNPESIQIGDKISILSSKKSESVKEVTHKVIAIVSDTDKPLTDNSSIDCEDELGNRIHTVQKGETLNKIAKKYKVKLNELKELNEEVVDNLPAGYQLIIKLGNLEVAEHQPIVTQVEDLKPFSLENVTKADFLIAKASEHIGTRYRGGGTTSAGFDCSGLMYSTFKYIDMTLPRSSSSMAAGIGVKIDKSNAQKGDLIFFTTNGRGSINHVGLITEISEDEIKFIHSSVQSGVIISSTKEPYYSKRFVQINRVLTN